ncbi:hypothetical protein KQ693_05945 [Thermus sp. PS18]|uniref:hypothetical protein n=1 Tax=Thermus sp. PS18 TaxID=2849039 RepID=UPI002263AF69|nr:hypothetical protein [Thermus sp. PS18]UZX16571.1 hypothetical protein KQ693_05945 [Thermus sp. PS18]
MGRVLAVAVVMGMALAQGEGIPTDVASWFTDVASLAAVVAALVALVRKHVLKALDGLAVVGLSVVLGVVLAYLGHALGYLGQDWLVFGLMAGLGASGGTAYLKSLTKGDGGAPSGDTRADASRARLR